MAANNQQQQKVLDYLKQIKTQFKLQVYKEFIEAMRDYKYLKIDTPGVISRVTNLFSGKKDIIMGRAELEKKFLGGRLFYHRFFQYICI